MNTVVGKSPGLQFDEDGFLIDTLSWTPELAIEIADTDGLLTLTPEHWKIIDYLREHYLKSSTLPVMNHVCRVYIILNGIACMRCFIIPGKPGGLPDCRTREKKPGHGCSQVSLCRSSIATPRKQQILPPVTAR